MSSFRGLLVDRALCRTCENAVGRRPLCSTGDEPGPDRREAFSIPFNGAGCGQWYSRRRFEKAAARLGLPPARAVVFEDAHVGIEAAHAAGMKVVAVATTHPLEELLEADLVVMRLDELTVAQVAAL